MPRPHMPDYIVDGVDALDYVLGERWGLLISANVPTVMDDRRSLEVEPGEWEEQDYLATTAPTYPARI